MKKIILAVMALLTMSGPFAYADDLTIRELFKVTEGKVVDWAILSSIETGYFRDMINGNSLVGAQFPVLYITPYITADFGYVTAYENKERGSLMFGGSLRLNKLIEDSFSGKVSMVRSFIPEADKYWDRLWFGPWISKRFADFDSTLMAGIKAGIAF